jgi:hypothetical protein
MSMSLKAIFAKVSKHLIKQNAKSRDSDGDCVYRDPQGQSCAIGCLIPEERYEESFEGELLRDNKDVQHVLKHAIGVNSKKRAAKIELLMSLMAVHDEFEPDEWETELAAVEMTYL